MTDHLGKSNAMTAGALPDGVYLHTCAAHQQTYPAGQACGICTALARDYVPVAEHNRVLGMLAQAQTDRALLRITLAETQAEVARLTTQVQECEDHNLDLINDASAFRAALAELMRAIEPQIRQARPGPPFVATPLDAAYAIGRLALASGAHS